MNHCISKVTASDALRQLSGEKVVANEIEGSGKKVLAKYSIPLGANEATLVFTGEYLTTEDFDALVEYVGLFKKQFDRKLNARLLERAKQASETDGEPMVGDP